MKNLLLFCLLLGAGAIISCTSGRSVKDNLPKESVQGSDLVAFDDLFYGKKFETEEEEYNFRQQAGQMMQYYKKGKTEEIGGSCLLYSYSLSPDKKTLYLQLLKGAYPTEVIIEKSDKEEGEEIHYKYKMLTYSEYVKYLKNREYLECDTQGIKRQLKKYKEYRMRSLVQLGLKMDAKDTEIIKCILENNRKFREERLDMLKKKFSRVIAYSIEAEEEDNGDYIELKEKFTLPSFDTMGFCRYFDGSTYRYHEESFRFENDIGIGNNEVYVAIWGKNCTGFLNIDYKEDREDSNLYYREYKMTRADKERVLFTNTYNFQDKITAKYLATGDNIALSFQFSDLEDGNKLFDCNLNLKESGLTKGDFILLSRVDEAED